MALNNLLDWLGNSTVGTAVAESTWMFPAAETVHVITITLVVGTVMVADLRLLNWTDRGHRIDAILRDALPWTWGAFALALVSGLIMFSSAPVKYVGNTYFLIKMTLMAAAGINMAIFHLVTQRGLSGGEDATTAHPKGAYLAGALSLAFWIGIVLAGRWIGFSSQVY